MSFLGRFRSRRSRGPIRLDHGLQMPCEVVPTDSLIVSGTTESPIGHAIAILCVDGRKGTKESVVLNPKRARVLAATILNLADELDGTVPLSFSEGES